MKKKILINAYINGNLGDDLFVKILCERYPNTQFYLIGEKRYKQFFGKIQNLHYIEENGIKKCVVKMNNIIRKLMKKRRVSLNERLQKKYINQMDTVVMIGGSMFIEQSNWKDAVEERRSIFDKKIYVLGCNFGSYTSKEYLLAYKNLFSKAEDVCFRDTYSYHLFEELENTRVAPDIILNLKQKQEIKEKYFVISVIDPNKEKKLAKYQNEYVTQMIEIVNCLTKENEMVVLMSFCEKEGDLFIVNKIFKEVNNKEKVKIYNHTNIEKSLSILQKSKGIIATRFHACVLAFLYNKKVIPIIYNEKTLNMLNDFSYTGVYFTLEQFGKIPAEQIVDKLKKQNKNKTVPIQLANQQFLKLDQYLLCDEAKKLPLITKKGEHKIEEGK